MEHNSERLQAHILPLSNASTFDEARKEWKLFAVEVHIEFDNCPCGKEIKELCHIENLENGNRTYVGNVCEKRFIGIDTGNLFDGLMRIIQDPSANANHDLIVHGHRMGYIFDSEYRFLMDTKNKRKLSAAQIEWKRKINRRIANPIVVKK